MSPTIPASPGSVEPYSSRIELVPSFRAASLVAAWLTSFCGSVLLGTALPLPVRIAICVVAATFGSAAIRDCFLLTGRKSVQALSWTERGELIARLGPGHMEKVVRLAPGSFRLGTFGLLVWLKSCDGTHTVYIDAGKQEVCAIRRLTRLLNGGSGRRSAESQAAS